jgi:hypothetical protein
VEGSFDASDSVLSFEKKLSQSFADDRKYAYEQRGSTTMKVYSEDYSDAYNKMLDGMVERRLRQAIIEIGSFWYTAWVNAGNPNLKALQERPVTEEMKNKLKEEEQLWKTGKLKPKGHEE